MRYFIVIYMLFVGAKINAHEAALCFDHTIINATEAYLNKTKELYLSFDNCSEVPLTIKNIESDRGFYSRYKVYHSFRSTPYNPGERDSIRFYLNTFTVDREIDTYDDVWRITYKESDHVQIIRLTFVLESANDIIRARPATVPTVQQGAPADFKIRLTNTSDRDTKIIWPKGTYSHRIRKQDEYPITIRAGKSKELSFVLRSEYFTKRYEQQLVLNTDHPDQPFLAIKYAGTIDSVGNASIHFDETELYCEFTEGEKAIYEFHFINDGDAPLIFSNVKSSCGCMVPYWDKEPVMPGDGGIIKAKYDTRRIGPFSKTMTVTCNASETPIRLRVRGKVHPKEEPPKNNSE